MKKSSLLLAITLGVTSVGTFAAQTSGWWRTVSAQASSPTPADHNQVCAKAESKLRGLYSDVTTVKLSPSFDQYNGILYCTARGQTQQ
jgi:hypothetical protein